MGGRKFKGIDMKNTAIYTIIISLTLIVPINPLVVYYVLNSRSTAVYAGMVDICALAVVVIAFLYIKHRTKLLSILLIVALIGVLPALFVGEISYVYWRQGVGNQILGSEKSRYMQANPLSLYSPIENAVGKHKSPGNFEVIYYFDEKGRKKIEQNASASQTIHFFGDSYTFGYGVTNDDTALNFLAKEINDQINVQNYGVGGYSLELMYLRLIYLIDEVKPGDVVVFSPISIDSWRGLPGKSRACGMKLGKGVGVGSYPRLVNGEVEFVEISQTCNVVFDTLLSNTTFLFGIGRLYRSIRDWVDYPKIVAAANEIFFQAERLALSRGATFHLIFLPTPRECKQQEHLFDLEGLETPYVSLLPRCPSDPQFLDTFHFRSDAHWTPLGNLWAADALHDVLREIGVID